MEHGDGEMPTEPPKLSDGGDGGGVDRLSELPDDVLIQILLKLPEAVVAARTCILSSRWRRLWTLLPRLCFASSTGPQSIRAALESHQAPALRLLFVDLLDATSESVAVWLPVAARRLSGLLFITNKAQENEEEDEEEAAEGAPLELPCFEDATSIYLDLGYLGLSVPPLGVFASLTQLLLTCIKLHGPCMLGDAVSSARCPVLEHLTVQHVSGLRDFSIHSDSLQKIKLERLHPDDALGLGNFTVHSQSLKILQLIFLSGLQQLTVVAPTLVVLDVTGCLASGESDVQPVAHISAPRLESLTWRDEYDPRFSQLGNMVNLQYLETGPFVVYGQDHRNHKLQNVKYTGLLGHFEVIQTLKFTLFFLTKDITNHEYLMEGITRFPKVSNLALDIRANGHSVGPSSYHVLRMCPGVRKLYLTLIDEKGCTEAQTACPSDCVCDQPPNWKTDKLALNCLQEVKCSKLRGTENEAGLVKRLFDWATVLETMTVTFDCSVAESKAKEFCKILQSFSRPEVCLKGPHFA